MGELRDAQRLDEALGIAYRFLSRRERTVAEVEQRLAEREVDAETIPAAIAELEQLGYLDDTGYARRFTHDRRKLDGWGDERIERRLRERGIDRHHITAALGRDEGEPTAVEAAVELVRRRFPVPPETARDRERVIGMLARKGYSSDEAHTALRSVLGSSARSG
ncbi:MAG: regulatory protein RecX [Baekduia sp.]